VEEQHTMRKTVSSKLIKTKILLDGGGLLNSHIPPTAPFSRDRFEAMLETHGMVYVKPDTGSQGIGILKAERMGSGGYRYQSGTEQHRFGTCAAMYRSMERTMGRRRYLVQKGIPVLTHQGRPFDFRVMTQRNPAGQWENTGIAARVAHPRKIVSNGSQGGTIYGAADLLRPIAGRERSARLIGRMNKLALLAADRLGGKYPAMHELGIDIAVDRQWKPWILEVNTRPDPCPFTKLTDRTAIRRIVRYGRAYGRRYCLKCGKAKSGTI